MSDAANYRILNLLRSLSEAIYLRMLPEEGNPLAGLTVRQAEIVRSVSRYSIENNDEISLKALADTMNVSSASLSESVDLLVKKKILCREYREEDRRTLRISLSEDGKKYIQSQLDAIALEIEKSIRAHSYDEIHAAVSVLEKINSALKK